MFPCLVGRVVGWRWLSLGGLRTKTYLPILQRSFSTVWKCGSGKHFPAASVFLFRSLIMWRLPENHPISSHYLLRSLTVAYLRRAKILTEHLKAVPVSHSRRMVIQTEWSFYSINTPPDGEHRYRSTVLLAFRLFLLGCFRGWTIVARNDKSILALDGTEHRQIIAFRNLGSLPLIEPGQSRPEIYIGIRGGQSEPN